MGLKLVFLGRLADVAGVGEQVLPLVASLGEVLAVLAPELAIALSDERIRIAVNGALISRDASPSLADGDEIAFLPPVSGG